MGKMNNRERVARNFVKKHGITRFKWMIQSFARPRSGREVAEELGVSRERVRQWKNMFGETITTYRLHPETDALLNGREEFFCE